MLIGADYDPPGVNSNEGNFWYGYIDEVRIWNKDLISTDVEFHYKNPDKLTQHYSPSIINTLIGLWRFNEVVDEFVPNESKWREDNKISETDWNKNKINGAIIIGNLDEVNWDTFGTE